MNKPRVCHTYTYLGYELRVFTKFGVKQQYEAMCRDLNYSKYCYSLEDAEEMFRDYINTKQVYIL